MSIKQLEVFTTQDGRQPLIEWLESLRDIAVRARILARPR